MGNIKRITEPDFNSYGKEDKLYKDHLLEQYKLCVQMADKISERRNTANVFFLTLHTTIITAIGFAIEKITLIEPAWFVTFPTVGIVVLCITWWWIIRSYRNLNTAKFKVIGKMEKLLPYSPFWEDEWNELGEGKDWKKYLPLTAIEQWVPIIFGLMYVMIAGYVINNG